MTNTLDLKQQAERAAASAQTVDSPSHRRMLEAQKTFYEALAQTEPATDPSEQENGSEH